MQAELQLTFDLGQRIALGREDFLVAPCNETVVSWLDRWPDWPGRGLFIYGPEGCGKTHLAHVFQAMSGAMLLHAADLNNSRYSYSSPPHVIVEDAGSDFDMSALLHLYNVAVERDGSLLLTGRKPPSLLQLELPDLKSRINSLGNAAVGLPDDALLASVLVKLFMDRQLKVSEDVIIYLVRRMERSFQAARHIVGALDDASLADRREITIPLVRQILQM